MTPLPRVSPPPRPDLAARLLAAVAERDHTLAERLVQQWVHRRGLAALDALIAGPLQASQGAEAGQWLRQRAGGDPATVAAVEPAVEQAVAPIPEPASAGGAAALWPQLAVVPGGAPAPRPRALAPLRAWLPDGSDQAQEPGSPARDTFPLAS